MSRQAKYKIFEAVLVSATENAVSEGIPIDTATGNFSFSGSLSSSVSSASVVYEVSNDGTNYDTTTSDPTRTIVSVLKGLEIVKGFNLPVAKKVRIRVTGLAGQPASTVTCTGELSFTEE
jgi:hypothetical protein